jgi:hypothetical protein
MIADPRQWAALHKRAGIHRDRPRAADRGSRICARCSVRQPIASFRMNGGYRSSYCKACALQVTQEWRERHRVELNARRRAAYAARKAAVMTITKGRR